MYHRVTIFTLCSTGTIVLIQVLQQLHVAFSARSSFHLFLHSANRFGFFFKRNVQHLLTIDSVPRTKRFLSCFSYSVKNFQTTVIVFLLHSLCIKRSTAEHSHPCFKNPVITSSKKEISRCFT